MKKLALVIFVFFSVPTVADQWSPNETITGIFIEDDGSFNYTTTGNMINPANCQYSRYTVPKNHPNRDLLYTHITLAWKNDYEINSRLASGSCVDRLPRVVKILVTK